MSGPPEGVDPGATPIGTLEGRPGMRVGPTGLVDAAGGFTVDWWIGADDRWHLPGREAGVRQHLVGDSPVVETRLRVPGGDAVQRTYGVRDHRGHEHVVVEIENDSGSPFALALVVSAVDLDGERTDLAGLQVGAAAGEPVLRAGGRTIAVLPKRPSRAAGATGWRAAAVAEAVTSGRAGDDLGDAAAGGAGSGPTAALLFPVAHRTSLRVLLPLDGEPEPDGFPPVPGPDLVAGGWNRMGGRGTSVSLPDSGLEAGIRASRAQLLLRGGQSHGEAALIVALDREGLHDEAAKLVAGLEDAQVRWRRYPPAAAGDLLDAVARHWALTRDDALAERLLPLLAVLAHRAAKAGPSAAPAMDRFAELLEGIGQPEAARSVRPPAFVRSRPANRWERLDERRRTASPTWCWADPYGREAFLRAVRDVLLAEDEDSLSVLPEGLGPWTGQPIELHGAPTAFGPFSFAVRWHGPRPALLWELDALPGSEGPVIRAPGLDPRWSSHEPKGEQLLGSTRDDGVAPPDPGGSFS